MGVGGRVRAVWLLAFCAVVGAVGFGTASLLSQGAGSASAPESSRASSQAAASAQEPTVLPAQEAAAGLQDGRGNDLVVMGDVPGGQWYCEADGPAEELIGDTSPPGDAVEGWEDSPQEQIFRLLERGRFDGNPAELMGASKIAYRVPETGRTSTELVDVALPSELTRSAVLAQVPDVSERQIVFELAIQDPRREANANAGFAKWVFHPAAGWELSYYGICISALRGFYEP